MDLLVLNQLGQDLCARLRLGHSLFCALPLLSIGQLQRQWLVRRFHVLAPIWRPEVVLVDLAPSDWMRVMEGDNPCVGPEHLLLKDLVRSERVLRVCLCGPWDVVLLCMTPAALELGVPERKVPVSEQLPHAVLLVCVSSPLSLS